MHASHRGSFLLLALASCALPFAADACGEGMFNTGQGLPYQAYLAPRPAAVLVFAEPGTPDTREDALHAGLKKAGHRVTVVRDVEALKAAMREQRFDVVIAALDGIDAVTSAEAEQTPPLLPVVARSVRNSPEVRNRFDLFLIDGASLGQYLKAINKMVARSPA
jgi:CheY-like chemotaxis protein